jgi:hypothetical protein
VRRRWPQSLISWTRLWSGGLQDPIVGGHILIGCALGVGYALLFDARRIAITASGGGLQFNELQTFLGPRLALGFAAKLIAEDSLLFPFGLLFLFFLVRAVVRNIWLAGILVVLMMSAMGALSNPGFFFLDALFGLAIWGFGVAILLRYGVLPMILAMFISELIDSSPLTTDFSVWYANSMFTALAIVLVITLWSFRTSLGGRKIWSGNFLENG